MRHADGVSNRLDAWIDFNRDGDWLDPGEHIFTNYDLGLGKGERVLPFTIPAGASIGDSFARFRVSTAGGLAPTGMANDGEVEDHRVPIVPFGQPVDVTLAANRATVELVRIDDQLIIRRRGAVLFAIPADGAGPLTLAGSPQADVFRVPPDIATPVTLDGGDGADRVILFAQSNVELTDARLSVAGGSSISLLSIDAASITGGDGPDLLDASAFSGPVTLLGGTGDDTLKGGLQNDRLIGQAGDDVLEGSLGDELFPNTVRQH